MKRSNLSRSISYILKTIVLFILLAFIFLFIKDYYENWKTKKALKDLVSIELCTADESTCNEEIRNNRNSTNFVEIDIDDLHFIINNAIVKKDLFLWKGKTYGIGKFKNGNEVIMDISSYGNFFTLEGCNSYFVYEKENAEQFEKILKKYKK